VTSQRGRAPPPGHYRSPPSGPHRDAHAPPYFLLQAMATSGLLSTSSSSQQNCVSPCPTRWGACAVKDDSTNTSCSRHWCLYPTNEPNVPKIKNNHHVAYFDFSTTVFHYY
jgi:hypothetical protein